MNRPVLPSCVTLAGLFLTACTVQAPDQPAAAAFDLAAARAQIAGLNQRFTAAHVTGDIATIDAMLAPDARSYPPGADVVVGSQALHDFTVAYVAAGVSEFTEETTDFYGNAEFVVDAGTYTVVYGPERVTERGKYLNVWVPMDGTWKIRTNMWNTSGPAPGPQ